MNEEGEIKQKDPRMRNGKIPFVGGGNSGKSEFLYTVMRPAPQTALCDLAGYDPIC